MHRFLRCAVLFVAALPMTVYALAGDLSPIPSRPSYGTSHDSVVSIHSFGFNPYLSSDTFETGAGGSRWATSGTGHFVAPITFPSGALVTSIQLIACDKNTNGSVEAALILSSVDGTLDSQSTILSVHTENGTAPGCLAFPGYPSSPIVIDNSIGKTYAAFVRPSPFDESVRFQAVQFTYRLQVSLAPNAAIFGDVPTDHPYFRAIEALAASGITSGCGNNNFCPNQSVTRGELAKFLANALGL